MRCLARGCPKQADFYTDFRNTILPMCAGHAAEVIKSSSAKGAIVPMPGKMKNEKTVSGPTQRPAG